ncbi:MAG: sigma D regulator [Algicola sp.]|nr:sigma D regulator [Algicola sp.]
MLTRLEQAQDKWGGSHSAIDNWLNERQELLVRYCQLAGTSQFDQQEKALPNEKDILLFCQVMMDYISAGHFEVYEQIVKACKVNGNDSHSLATTLYPKIDCTTDTALTFNDRYADKNSAENAGKSAEEVFASFDTDLSHVGQALEERFGFEDELIETLYKNH